MGKALLSLNFMHCMERLATQIYRTQKSAFKKDDIVQQLTDASENERTHVQKLRTQIKKLNGRIYPFGWLFQLLGAILGILTRLSSKGYLFKMDLAIELRAVKDYHGFLKSVSFDKGTADLIRMIIGDEEVHIINWRKARELYTRKK